MSVGAEPSTDRRGRFRDCRCAAANVPALCLVCPTMRAQRRRVCAVDTAARARSVQVIYFDALEPGSNSILVRYPQARRAPSVKNQRARPFFRSTPYTLLVAAQANGGGWGELELVVAELEHADQASRAFKRDATPRLSARICRTVTHPLLELDGRLRLLRELADGFPSRNIKGQSRMILMSVAVPYSRLPLDVIP